MRNFKIINIDHHLSHISSAFHLSGFETSSVLSVDGFGDFGDFGFGDFGKHKRNVKYNLLQQFKFHSK